MNTQNPTEKTAARRLVEASAWRAHLTETDRDSTPAFESWLAAHDGNRQAWQRVCQPWDLFGEQATSPEVLDLRRRALGQARAMGRQRWRGRSTNSRVSRIGVAAAVVLLAFSGLIAFNVMGHDIYRTGAGERRVVTLADGSKLQLDSLTELRVEFSKRARELTLIRGQARFDVAHDVERPFSVLAAGQKVIAIGTAFNVDLLNQSLFVTLIEGKVVILPQGSEESGAAVATSTLKERAVQNNAATTGEPAKVIELAAGQQLAISESGATSVEPANVQQATAWQNGQLVFENERLSSVIARVNRYATQPIIIDDSEAASLPLSGVFNAGDVEGFISTITQYLPIKAEWNRDVIRLSSNSPSADVPRQARQ